jgi:hypothetical protein
VLSISRWDQISSQMKIQLTILVGVSLRVNKIYNLNETIFLSKKTKQKYSKYQILIFINRRLHLQTHSDLPVNRDQLYIWGQNNVQVLLFYILYIH